MQNGYLDSVPVDKVKQFQLKLQDYLPTRKESVLASIVTKGALDKELEARADRALEDFKSTNRSGNNQIVGRFVKRHPSGVYTDALRLTWQIPKTCGAGSNRSATRRRSRRRCRWSRRRRCARPRTLALAGRPYSTLMNRVLVSLAAAHRFKVASAAPGSRGQERTRRRHQHGQGTRRGAEHQSCFGKPRIPTPDNRLCRLRPQGAAIRRPHPPRT